MNWLEEIVRPEIWQMKGYSSARQECELDGSMVKLDANESPFTIPNEKSNLNRYPEPQPRKLLYKLATTYHVKTDQVLITRGMDEVIDLLIRIFCTPYKDNIVITPPTFGFYTIAAHVSSVKVLKSSLDETNNFCLDVDKLLEICDDSTKVVFLCTPNNPTGNLISLDVIQQVCQELPKTIIAVDEAYIEFADAKSATTLLSKYPNLLVMRTLSKAYAAAGLRLGTLIADPNIIQLAKKVLAPYPIPTPSIDAALKILSPAYLELADTRINFIKSERQRVYDELVKLSQAPSSEIVQVYKSQANFILIKVVDATKTYNKLLSRGIVVRNRSSDIMNTLRITIGSREENDLLLSALGVARIASDTSERTAEVVRKTNETEICVQVNLDVSNPIKISTQIGFFDHMLEQLAKHGNFSLQVMAIGDTHVDYHHTVEDVAISLGEAMNLALGDKCGVARYGFVLPMDESLASASIDLSGRGVCVFEGDFKAPIVGDFPVEMVEHFFNSFAHNLKASIHLKVEGENAHHMVEGVFKACAKALKQAIQIENDNIPSTKGVL